MSKRYTAQDFLKTENVLSFSPEDTLSKAIAGFRSSHDACFVMDEKNILLGAVSPHYTQIHSNFPPETKLKRAMLMPPKLSLSTPLPKILRDMLESKMYFLPVVDDDGILQGIVSFRRILKHLFGQNDVLSHLEKDVFVSSPIVITKNITIAKAREILRKKKLSRLPVVNDNGVLIGLLTRFDLKGVLGSHYADNRIDRMGSDKKILDQPAGDYMQALVVTMPEGSSILSVFDTMRTKKVGSVVLVDGHDKPTGIIGYRDILLSLIRYFNHSSSSVSVSTPDDFGYKNELIELVSQKFLLLGKKYTLVSTECRLTEGKNSDDSPKWYEVSLSVLLKKNARINARSRAKGWRLAFAQAFDTLKTQI